MESSERTVPFAYSPIVARPKVEWPGGARLALWVVPCIQHYRYGLPSSSGIVQGSVGRTPDVANHSWKDYGVRVGVWRIMDVLDEFGVKGTVALTSDVCHHYPIIVEECVKRNWELMGSGTTPSIRLHGLSPDEQRAIIREAKATIEKATGRPVTGWLGPALGETFDTLQILYEEGIRYVADWVNDDQPYPFQVGDGSLLSIPYSIEVNDITAYLGLHYKPEDFFRLICEQFDVLYKDSERTGRVMALSVHTFLTGIPYRIGVLRRALEYIRQHDKVWYATGEEIVSWYRTHYIEHHEASA